MVQIGSIFLILMITLIVLFSIKKFTSKDQNKTQENQKPVEVVQTERDFNTIENPVER